MALSEHSQVAVCCQWSRSASLSCCSRGSGLMLRSLGKLIAVHPGFNGSDLLTMRLSLLADSAANASSTSYYDRLLTRVRALPGVTSAALTVCPATQRRVQPVKRRVG